MKTEHTPGPLSIHQAARKTDGGFDWAIRDQEGKVIGEAFEVVGHGDTRPAGDNARLWAAAPEMLAALEIVHEWASDTGAMCDDEQEWQAVIDAIAKARS